MKKYNIIPFVTLVLFIIIYILFRLDYIIYFDNYVYSFISINDFFTTIMTIITFFGEPKTIFYIIVLLLLFLKNKREKILIVVNSLIGLNVFHFLKIIIKRPRPSHLSLIKETGYSFPSGHSFMTLIFYGFILYLINRNKDRFILKNIINMILILLIILMPISRVYLGVHYASDTIAGISLGITYLFVFINLINKRKLL